MNAILCRSLPLLAGALLLVPAAVAQTRRAPAPPPFTVSAETSSTIAVIRNQGATPGIFLVLAAPTPRQIPIPGLPPLLADGFLVMVEPAPVLNEPILIPLPAPALDCWLQPILVDSDGQVCANPPFAPGDLLCGGAPEPIVSDTVAHAGEVQLQVDEDGIHASYEARTDGHAWLPVEIPEDVGDDTVLADMYFTLQLPSADAAARDLAQTLTATAPLPPPGRGLRIWFGVQRADGGKVEYVLLRTLSP